MNFIGTVLQEAEHVATGDRYSHYGHPLDNHGCTADFWTAYLKRRGLLVEDKWLTPEDVCFLNVLQKTSRAAHMLHRDNLVDIAGYARNVEMIWQEIDRRGAERDPS